MCLLDGMFAKVQVPRWVAHQQLVLGLSFCGCGSSNLEPPDHVNTRRLLSTFLCDGGK